jgi:hypothetical protein
MDEHSTEHIEMDERLPYRLGSPILAPMPLRAVRTTPFEGHGTLWPIIDKIIKAENITLEAGYYCSKRIPRWCDDADVKTTILFKGDMKEMVKWKAALQQLRTAVDKVSKDIFIELIDSGAVEGLASGIIRPEHQDLLDVWPILTSAIFGIIAGRHWMAVDFLVRGALMSRINQCQCPPSRLLSYNNPPINTSAHRPVPPSAQPKPARLSICTPDDLSSRCIASVSLSPQT